MGLGIRSPSQTVLWAISISRSSGLTGSCEFFVGGGEGGGLITPIIGSTYKLIREGHMKLQKIINIQLIEKVLRISLGFISNKLLFEISKLHFKSLF
jgi:hypothetical protein